MRVTTVKQCAMGVNLHYDITLQEWDLVNIFSDCYLPWGYDGRVFYLIGILVSASIKNFHHVHIK